tara:strand:- start:318 stop:551 length:234 start_codon:yes stop_codon:yes gene_type:complete
MRATRQIIEAVAVLDERQVHVLQDVLRKIVDDIGDPSVVAFRESMSADDLTELWRLLSHIEDSSRALKALDMEVTDV